MKINIYTIYDTASGLYRFPMFVSSDGEALRSFSDAALNAESDIGKHPEDYTIFRNGSFNDVTGEILGEQPESLKTALACVAASRQIIKDELPDNFAEKDYQDALSKLDKLNTDTPQ